jgi:2-iminobutanoate/2-iminopropanoate deaminase
MSVIRHNPASLFPPYRAYSHATEIRGDARLLIISGINGYLSDGKTMPESFEEQGEVIWTHLGSILHAAEMDYGDLVSIKYLGNHQPASTVVCCQLLLPEWKLEVEAMAAR